ncbi:RusA family crossover junction endodeoxyribonuclease [Staphylococcus epidermidis]|nr:RusA family crossover junction endodeoxyribonuclease [Staphylococcus epidermidis]
MMRTMNKIDEIVFELDIRPISASRPRVFKNGGVSHSETYQKFAKDVPTEMKNLFSEEEIELMRQKLRNDDINIGYKVHQDLIFRCNNEDFWDVPMIVKPDIDNVIKSVFDQVYNYFGLDDKRIFSVESIKKYGSNDKIVSWIEVFEIPKYVSKRKTSRKTKKEPTLEDLKKELEKLMRGVDNE